ncbi:MAG: shikimate dehydrogenase [Hyphomicrobiales bacterium]|nr:MAG: shikimate dehydrogenase [Hyphomicrobiales bacterium]
MAGAISGRTRLFAVLGDPVAQVMAPSLMNRLFAENDVDAVLVPIEVSRGELSAVIEGLKRIRNLDGFLVTVPHKFAVGHHADRLSDEATLSGSTNAMRREFDGTWSGENFDGEGFVRGLLAAGHAVTDRRFTLVGAGGAGAAIAASLLKAGAATLSIVDTDRLRAEALAALFDTRFKGNAQAVDTPDVESDVVVNATPLGLREDDPLPFALDRLRADTIIADIVMKPAETRLLLAAARRGFRTHPGLPMLSEQIPLYREFFRIH